MISIREEIAAVESGSVDPNNNVLKGAPHTADMVLSDSWNRPYKRELAAYPLPYLRSMKCSFDLVGSFYLFSFFV